MNVSHSIKRRKITIPSHVKLCEPKHKKNLGIIKITEVSHSRYLVVAKFLYNYNYNCAL